MLVPGEAYTELWNNWRKLNKAYCVARRYHKRSLPEEGLRPIFSALANLENTVKPSPSHDHEAFTGDVREQERELGQLIEYIIKKLE